MKSDLGLTFKALKKKIRPYSKKLQILSNQVHRFELCGRKEFEVRSLKTGKSIKKKNGYFVGIIQRPTYVGFYFMPSSTQKSFMKDFSPALNKRLKGKCCFHFKAAQEVTSEVDQLLEKGFRTFKEMGIL